MSRKAMISVLGILLLSTSLHGLVISASAQPPNNPNELIVATIGEPETVDPAWCYDTGSAGLIFNVYDTLIRFEGEYTDRFVPSLATEWSYDSDTYTYTFKIRNPPSFHCCGRLIELPPDLTSPVCVQVQEIDPVEGREYHIEDWEDSDGDGELNVRDYIRLYRKDWPEECPGAHTLWRVHNIGATTMLVKPTLKPWDVEYSLERWMVQDRHGGPAWMIYEPLLGTYEADLSDPEAQAKAIDDAINSDETHVYLHCVGPFPQMIVLQTLAQSWASILQPDFCIDTGCWPATWHLSPGEYSTWVNWNNPEISPLDDPEPVMCGTGPYMFDYWEHGLELSIIKFDYYWGGWPASHPVMGNARGYVERVTVKYVDEWATRKLMFLVGDVDFCYVPRMYMEDVWQQPGITCVYPLAELSASGFFFSFDVQSTSRYLRAPFTSYECGYGELNEGGFPPDLFTDIHVRRGFAYCVDYFEFLAIAFLGEAVYPATPAIFGLPYRQSDDWYAEHQYVLDLAKAEEELKLAWGGELWETGFTLPLCYNTGNLARKTLAEMMEANVELLNPKFHIDVYEVEWGTVYIPELFAGELTCFVIGWLADYPDPHNFFHPFMHTYGAFAAWQFYSNPEADALIEEGGTCTDPVRREEIYFELQQMYIDECPSVLTHQAAGRHWERDWVQGWYYNPIYPGSYFYHLWKEELPREDMNDDGAVNIMDIARCAVAFGSYYEVGDVHPRWDSYSDINQDTNVNILDIAAIAAKFGYVAPPWS